MGQGSWGLLGRIEGVKRIMVVEGRDAVGAAVDGEVRKREGDVSAWRIQG